MPLTFEASLGYCAAFVLWNSGGGRMRTPNNISFSCVTRVLSLVALYIFISGCKGDSCNPERQNYQVENYSAQSIELVDADEFGYVRPDYNVPEINSDLSWSDYGIYLSGVIHYYTAANESTKKHKKQLQIFPSAHACSPAPPQTEQIITSFVIVSDGDFSELHPAGTDISEFFQPVYMGFPRQGNFETLSEYAASNPAPPEQIFLVLLQQPEFERHNFTISIDLNDGTSLEMQTGDIYLTD